MFWSDAIRSRAVSAAFLSAAAVLSGCADHQYTGPAEILAHRGVHQPLSTEGMTRESCTAARMMAGSGHSFIENTLPSMAEAFRLGATAVEVDIHPTTDGDFAVFHDWTLECRTDGQGLTRAHRMSDLRRLDVGHGYTADGGRTFPLRGKGVGLMPTLGEVLTAFPHQRLHINIKGSDTAEAERLAAYLAATPNSRPGRLTVFADEPVRQRLEALVPAIRTYSKETYQSCARDYLLSGWLVMPTSCRDTVFVVPFAWRRVFWGWPHTMARRFNREGSELYLGGDVQMKVRSIGGFDDPSLLEAIPKNWSGGVVTDRIELIGPELRRREK